MSLLSEARPNLQLAWRLAKFDKTAVDAFPDDDRTVWRSFWALPFVLLLDQLAAPLAAAAFPDIEADSARASISVGWLVVGWFLALNIAAEFAGALGRADRLPRYVVAHNWCAVVQASVFTSGVALLALLGAPEALYRMLIMVVGMWSLVYDWHVVKQGLNLNGWPAALLIAILLVAALIMTAVAQSFSAA